MTTCITSKDPYQCPGKLEIFRGIVALLPSGRAWQRHEDLFMPGSFIGADVGEFQTNVDQIGPGVDFADQLPTAQKFWYAVAEVMTELHARACALLEEMFCSTVDALEDEWKSDYGIPDPCGTAMTLCQRVETRGGSSTTYLTELAASLGWTIVISECDPQALPSAHAGCARVGCAKTCHCPNDTMFIDIDSGSEAYVDTTDPIVCIIEKYKPANIRPVFSLDGELI
jgi:uncharacterized protein YmfQ (DUF2313 family)